MTKERKEYKDKRDRLQAQIQDGECTRMQKEWLSKNKPKQCPDAYLDNPHRQSEWRDRNVY